MINENMHSSQPQIVIIDKRSGNASGILSVIFGVIGIFMLGLIFVPLSIVAGIVALINKQFVLGGFGLVLATIAALTSPTLWLIFGLSGLASLAA